MDWYPSLKRRFVINTTKDYNTFKYDNNRCSSDANIAFMLFPEAGNNLSLVSSGWCAKEFLVPRNVARKLCFGVPSASTFCFALTQGQDPFVAEDWDRLLMTVGALDLLLIREFGWCRGFCIHVWNTSPVVIIWRLHYGLLANSPWHSYKPTSRGLYLYGSASVLVLFGATALHLIFGSKTSGFDNIPVMSIYSEPSFIVIYHFPELAGLCSLKGH